MVLLLSSDFNGYNTNSLHEILFHFQSKHKQKRIGFFLKRRLLLTEQKYPTGVYSDIHYEVKDHMATGSYF